MPLTINTLYRRIFKIWRNRRFELFLRLIRPSATETLLDVGGYPGLWISRPPLVARVDTLNVHEPDMKDAGRESQAVRSLIGDGCALSMDDQSYDIGYSNSVIEHVGSWERQQQFAAEIRRVARKIWVQTPAFGCPIEPHYLAPFVHWLPSSIQRRIMRWGTPWGWLSRPTQAEVDAAVASTRLLRKSEMRRLFPDCQILTERLLWVFPKSYIAVRAGTG